MALDLNLEGRMNTVLTVIIGAVVVLVVIAALTPTFFDALSDVVNNITSDNVTTGNSAADALLVAFAPIIGIIGAVTFLRLILRGMRQG